MVLRCTADTPFLFSFPSFPEYQRKISRAQAGHQTGFLFNLAFEKGRHLKHALAYQNPIPAQLPIRKIMKLSVPGFV
jgi:hypothetical protein